MKHWSLNLKIASLLALAFLTTAIIGGIGFFGIQNLRVAIDYSAEKTAPRVIIALTSQSSFRQLALAQYRMATTSNKEYKQATVKELETSHENLLETFKSAKSLASPENLAKWEEAERVFNEWWVLSEAIQRASLDNNTDLAYEISTRQRPLRAQAEKIFNEISEANQKQMLHDQHEADETYYRVRDLLLIVMVTGMSLCLVITIVTMKAISKSISQVIASLQDGAIQVTSASAQIASAAEELSQAATEQAASLEETAASVEEMNSMVAKNSENANSTADLSQKSTDASAKGQKVVEKMIEAMGQIDKSNATIMEQVNESNQQIAGIVKVVEQIAKKTEVINAIVNKTELLSFNASVEAARAGEHGKGFAVVAEEVGNLARMSGAAAEEISSLIEDSIEGVNKIVEETATKVGALIEAGKRQIEQGSEVAKECGEVLNEIVGNVKSVSSMSTEIASASTEQARGISEITKAMSQLDQMTQQNAATSEECAQAAEELSAQSVSLKNTVANLILTINGRNAKTNDLFENSESSGGSEPKSPMRSYSAAKERVLHLKPKSKPQSGNQAPPLRKAAGDVPDYNNDGFTDV
jgi:methyl-accepting chemotaxis protein